MRLPLHVGSGAVVWFGDLDASSRRTLVCPVPGGCISKRIAATDSDD